MKEDILEQLVEDWLVSEPSWFVKHNIKFRPSKESADYNSKRDSVHSDIDVLAISGTLTGLERVRVVTCKSWQGGFDPGKTLKILEGEAKYNDRSEQFQRREEWKYYRELVSTKWMKAFIDKIEAETGQRDFEYCIAVTKLRGKQSDREALQNSEIIRKRFAEAGSRISLRLIPLEEIVHSLLSRQSEKQTSVPESTDVGRLLQLLKAAGIRLESNCNASS